MLRPQIFTRARDRPSLDKHTRSGTGAQKNSNLENLKFALKFRVCTPYNFGVNVNILMRLFQPTCREAGVITCVQFLEDPPRKIWEGQKNVQISARFLTTFDCDREYLRNVCPSSCTSKIRKVVDQIQPLPGWTKETW